MTTAWAHSPVPRDGLVCPFAPETRWKSPRSHSIQDLLQGLGAAHRAGRSKLLGTRALASVTYHPGRLRTSSRTAPLTRDVLSPKVGAEHSHLWGKTHLQCSEGCSLTVNTGGGTMIQLVYLDFSFSCQPWQRRSREKAARLHLGRNCHCDPSSSDAEETLDAGFSSLQLHKIFMVVKGKQT